MRHTLASLGQHARSRSGARPEPGSLGCTPCRDTWLGSRVRGSAHLERVESSSAARSWLIPWPRRLAARPHPVESGAVASPG